MNESSRSTIIIVTEKRILNSGSRSRIQDQNPPSSSLRREGEFWIQDMLNCQSREIGIGEEIQIGIGEEIQIWQEKKCKYEKRRKILNSGYAQLPIPRGAIHSNFTRVSLCLALMTMLDQGWWWWWRLKISCFYEIAWIFNRKWWINGKDG